jgi:uncharacterized protein YbjT (DUF2867 family)
MGTRITKRRKQPAPTKLRLRTALMIGASGLVGSHCLRILLDDDNYRRVTVLVRRPLPTHHTKLNQHIVDFDNITDRARLIKADDVFCCIGTTMNAAGTQDAFRKVDYTYPVQIATMAARNHSPQILLVSAMGANRESSIFYSRVKGEMEETISQIPFECVQIFRPSFLLGDRDEPRFGERFAVASMKILKRFMVGPLRKYRPIEAADVARAMVSTAKHERRGIQIYNSDKIQSIADQSIKGAA